MIVEVQGASLWTDSAGRDAARRRRLARLTEAERDELANATPERFRQLMWTTDFADRRQVRLPLYQWPRDESIFAAVNRSFQDLVDRGLADQVRRLEIPVVVIHGAHDEPARAREVAELAPQGRFVELEHSAHVPWLEEPAALRDILRDFIRELAA